MRRVESAVLPWYNCFVQQSRTTVVHMLACLFKVVAEWLEAQAHPPAGTPGPLCLLAGRCPSQTAAPLQGRSVPRSAR